MEITLHFKVQISLDEERQKDLMDNLGITDASMIPNALAKSFYEELGADTDPGTKMSLISMEVKN